MTKTSHDELRNALKSDKAMTVSAAAARAGDEGRHDLLPDLAAALRKFLGLPTKNDKGCRAKLALLDALDQLDSEDDDLLFLALRHVQMEACWGPPIDTAANLRANAALALARRRPPGLAIELTDLLVDPAVEARRGAVKALAELGNPESVALLRLKALTGDDEPDVVGGCLSGLMQLDPERSFPLVERFLYREDPAIAEEAALALGDTRMIEAFQALRRCWDSSPQKSVRTALLLPIALTRCDDAFDFLIEVVLNEVQDVASEALRALHVFGGDPEHQLRVSRAVEERDEPTISKQWAETIEGRHP